MNIKELKHKMEHVPDHTMRHDRPMRGPIRKAIDKSKDGGEKKWTPSPAMVALIEKRKARFPHQYTPEAQAKSRESMKRSFAIAKGEHSEREKKTHQARIGRAYSE